MISRAACRARMRTSGNTDGSPWTALSAAGSGVLSVTGGFWIRKSELRIMALGFLAD